MYRVGIVKEQDRVKPVYVLRFRIATRCRVGGYQ